jgi:hypothetical protein
MKQKLLFTAAAFALTLSATNARVGVMTEATAKVADDTQRTFVAIEKLATAEGIVELEGSANVLGALYGVYKTAVTEALGDVDVTDQKAFKAALKKVASQLAKMAAKSTEETVKAEVVALAPKTETSTDVASKKTDEVKKTDKALLTADQETNTAVVLNPASAPASFEAPELDDVALLTANQQTNTAVVLNPASAPASFEAPELDDVATPESVALEQEKSAADKALMAEDAAAAIAELEADF